MLIICFTGLKNFKFDPADHPKLPKDLKKWLSCIAKGMALKEQLHSMLIRREQIRRRLATSGWLSGFVRALYPPMAIAKES